MKPETSEFIDRNARVLEIAKMLNLPLPYRWRSAANNGTYVYFFTRRDNFDLKDARNTLIIKSTNDASFTAVAIDIPSHVNKLVALQLDPRAIVYRNAAPAHVDQLVLTGRSETPRNAKPPVKTKLDEVNPNHEGRYFKIITSVKGLGTGYLIKAERAGDAVTGVENIRGERVFNCREIDPLEFVVLSLTGNYEVIQIQAIQ